MVKYYKTILEHFVTPCIADFSITIVHFNILRVIPVHWQCRYCRKDNNLSYILMYLSDIKNIYIVTI